MLGTARILVYHAIQTDGDFPSSARTNVPPDLFERQLDHLRKRYAIVPLDEAVDGKRGPGKNPLALTFDDGYRDTYAAAYRILCERGCPFTLFLTVSRIGKDWPFPRGPYPGLNWKQVNEMAANPLIGIGSHGLRHTVLTRLPPEEAKAEIGVSRMILEEKIPLPCRFFSYPHGSFNAQVKEYVRRAGYRAAFSVISPNEDDFSLRRVLISRKDTMLRFMIKLSPLYWPLRKLI